MSGGASLAGLLAGMLGEAPHACGTCTVLRTVLGLGALGKEGLLDVLEEGRGQCKGMVGKGGGGKRGNDFTGLGQLESQAQGSPTITQ